MCDRVFLTLGGAQGEFGMDILSIGFGAAFVASVLINAGLLLRMVQHPQPKFLIPGEDEAFLIKDRKTGQTALVEAGAKVKQNDPWIITFAKRNRLSFPVYDRLRRQITERELTSETGGISLRIHTTTPAPFPVITNDGHSVLVTASVSFAVERDRAVLLSKLADFGAQLERRIHSAFSSAIGALRDEEMRMKLGDIEVEVTAQLEKMESSDHFGVPLGIRIYEARFQYEDTDNRKPQSITFVDSSAPEPAKPGAATVASDAEPIHSAQVINLLPSGPASSSSAERPGAMQFAGTELDKLLDQFKGRSPEQVAALMKMMELQTRQNIVATLAETGGVIVFSAKELGLGGNPVVEDAVVNALTPSLTGPKAAE